MTDACYIAGGARRLHYAAMKWSVKKLSVTSREVSATSGFSSASDSTTKITKVRNKIITTEINKCIKRISLRRFICK
jgi:hypothetical protein